MGIITVSISDEAENKLRETAKKKLGEGKGVLGKAVEEAVNKWADEDKQKEIAERQIQRMKQGLYSLGRWKFNREEIYDRGL